MIKRIKCKTCGGDRDMSECDGNFVCSACGTVYDLQYIADTFYTPLMVQASLLLNDLKALGEVCNDSEENGVDREQNEECSPDDETVTTEEFLSSEDICPEDKAAFCLHNFTYYAATEDNPDKAFAFVDKVLEYDAKNFAASLLKALNGSCNSQLYTLHRGDNAGGQFKSFTEAPIASEHDDSVEYHQGFLAQIYDKKLAEQVSGILELLLTAIQNAPSEELCLETFHLASMKLSTIEVDLRLNKLHNIKELPSIDRYGEYLDITISLDKCQQKLRDAINTRMDEFGVNQNEIEKKMARFTSPSPDMPDWQYYLSEAEYQTAVDIWNRDVISHVNPRTNEVDLPHLLSVLDSACVVRLLLGLNDEIAEEEVGTTHLGKLLITRKSIVMALRIMQEIKEFDLKAVDPKQILSQEVSSQELAKRLALIDEVICNRMNL